jgi:SAM-dependent methyltransferase
LPFPDNFFDSISAYDVIEHLSRDYGGKNEFIFYMNELYRVLKKNGNALFVFPSYPNLDAFSDPTHLNFVTQFTLDYFLGDNSNGGYSGISTCYKKIVNKKLRFWKKWVNSCFETEVVTTKTIRIRMSLLKRELKRLLFPQHRIWILEKTK